MLFVASFFDDTFSVLLPCMIVAGKKYSFFLLSLLQLVLSSNFYGAVCTASSGNWNSPATWSCARVPTDNDVIIIPENVVVTVDCNCYRSSFLSGVVIEVYGTLKFGNGKKMDVAADGILNLYPGAQVTGGNPGSSLFIGENNVYEGGATALAGPGSFSSTEIMALPTKLISFNATLTASKKVELKWATLAERNSDLFTVERSSNGLTFTNIVSVKGAGNSSSRRDYSLEDNSPAEGTSYYRIKQTNPDGKFEYFNMINIHYETEPKGTCVLKIYPNPCIGKCTISLNDCKEKENSEIKIEILDALGNKVFSRVPARDENGSFQFSIDTKNNLSPGVYIIRGASDSEKYTEKVIVK